MDDRIRLAKAMGMESTTISNGSWAHINTPAGKAFKDFDPFTDANDDYAVLEWMRKTFSDQQIIDELEDGWSKNHCDQYRIGDYARAALKVISDD